MKKTLKRIFAVLLCALIAIGTMPFAALADEATAGIEQAISNYEQSMDGKIKTNMTAAYDAYVEANKALDAYRYGDAQVDLNAYANSLNSAVNAMAEWSYNGITSVTPSFSADSGNTSNYAAQGVANILYWSTPVVTATTVANVVVELWYPSSTVLLLDGKHTPAMPVVSVAQKNANRTRYVYQLYPCVSATNNADNEYFRLRMANNRTAWFALSSSSTDYDKNWIQAVTSSNANVKGEAGEPATNIRVTMERNF